MERALIEYLANALWQLPLLTFGAWILLRALRAAPLVQHTLWLVVLALAVLLPLIGIRRTTQPETPPPDVPQATMIEASNFSDLPSGAPTLPAQRPRSSLFLLAGTIRLTPRMAHAISALFIGVLLFSLLRLGIAWQSTRNLVAQSAPACLPAQSMSALREHSQRLGISVPQLRESSSILAPAAVGFRSPVLLLPPDFSRHTEDQIEAALCHELAHIYRHDYLANLLCRLAALPVGWHPALQFVQRRISRTREMICDAIAARLLSSEIRYAHCLLSLAQSMLRGREIVERTHALVLFSLGLFSKDTLEERVMRLLESENAASIRTNIARAITGAVVIASTVILAAVVHLTPVLAQSQAASAPQNAQVAPAPLVAPALPQELTPLPPLAVAAPKTYPLSAPSPAPAPTAAPAPAPQAIASPQEAPHSTTCGQLSAEDRQQLEKDLREAQEELQRARANSADVKRQMEEAQQQMDEAKAKLNSPEFRKQIDEAAGQAKAFGFDSDAFKKQMAEFQKQLKAGLLKNQIRQSQHLAADAARQSAEMKKQMAELQKQLNSDEIRRQMDEAMKSMKESQEQLKSQQLR
jgi:beta-lactamase regulating signal transducer with metallopeptidase domain